MVREYFLGKDHYCRQQQCLGTGDQPCPQKWGSNSALKPKMVNPMFQHHTPFVQPTEVTLKLASLYHIIFIHHWKKVFLSSILCKIKISPCGLKFNTVKISKQKRVHINYSDIYPYRLFGIHYQHQVMELICLGAFWVLIPYHFTWVNEPRNTVRNNSLPKTKWFFHGVNFVMSAHQYIIVLRETHKV